ncbi:MAG: TonB-dependent receptor plug domain-containing protein [Salinibacter sp.]
MRSSRLLLLCAVLAGAGLLGCSSSSTTRTATAEKDTIHTGYSTQKESESTTATTTVEPSQQAEDYAQNLSDLLQGRTAGVQVSRTGGGQVRILIRGPSSFNAGNEPLYVVDGTPVSPGPNGVVPVNPRNVKSITVLKDAGSTAIYGSRGAAGVIVIETKH